MLNPPILNALLYTIAATAAFAIPAFFIPADGMVEYASSALMLACSFAIWRWHKTAIRAFAQGATKPQENGILAIYILAWGLIFGRVFQVTYIRLGRPDWLISIPLSASFTYILAIGMGLFVIATRIDGEKPSKAWGAVTAFFAAVAIFFTSLWPTLVTKSAAIAKFFSSIF